MSFLESVHRWRLKAERLEKRVVLAGNDDVDLLKVKASRVGISTGDGSDDVYLLNVGRRICSLFFRVPARTGWNSSTAFRIRRSLTVEQRPMFLLRNLTILQR